MKSKIKKLLNALNVHKHLITILSKVSYAPELLASLIYIVLALIAAACIIIITQRPVMVDDISYNESTIQTETVYGSAQSEKRKYDIEYMFTVNGYKYYKAVDGDVILYFNSNSIISIVK